MLVGGRSSLRSLRHGIFSITGLICAWALAAGFVVPAGLIALLSMHEGYFIPLSTLGMWWIAGTVAVHWWIPTVEHERNWREAVASAGWHIALVTAMTSVVGWFVLFRDGVRFQFTVGEMLPVVVTWVVVTAIVGITLIWLRGHNFTHTLRYSLFSLLLGSTWMVIGLVTAHGGL